jgi:hypothetical protein
MTAVSAEPGKAVIDTMVQIGNSGTLTGPRLGVMTAQVGTWCFSQLIDHIYHPKGDDWIYEIPKVVMDWAEQRFGKKEVNV